jgi:hypothetical protein
MNLESDMGYTHDQNLLASFASGPPVLRLRILARLTPGSSLVKALHSAFDVSPSVSYGEPPIRATY